MTLILKLYLDMVKMYHHTKDEVSMSTHLKVIVQTDTQTDTMKTLHLLHTREVIRKDVSWQKYKLDVFCASKGCTRDQTPYALRVRPRSFRVNLFCFW